MTQQIDMLNCGNLNEHRTKVLLLLVYTNSKNLGVETPKILHQPFRKLYFAGNHFPIAAPINPPAIAEPPTTVAAARTLPGR